MKIILRLVFIILIAFFIDVTVYAYTEYKVGDIVSYNDIEFYVIKHSGIEEDSVTMLKAEPLTVEEVNKYGGVGTDNNHVNVYATQDTSSDYYQKAYNHNGYGGMVYYSSETCGYNSVGYWTDTDCKNDYASSEVKYVVDAWAQAKVPETTEARLIKYEELFEFGEIKYNETSSGIDEFIQLRYVWLYNNNYYYWTMTPYQDSTSHVHSVGTNGGFYNGNVSADYYSAVRPVIVLKKTFLGDVDESIIVDNNASDKQENTLKVKVANTYMSQAIIIIIAGFISICGGIVIYYIFRNRKIISRR